MSTVALGSSRITLSSKSELIQQIQAKIQSQEQSYCIPLNVSKYITAEKDDKLQEVIHQAQWVIADGMPITWLAYRLGYRLQRVTGTELAEELLELSQQQGWRVFILGTKSEVLLRAIDKIKQRYPLLQHIQYHHGYFTATQLPEVLEKIQLFAPDILLLGLAMPQKEYFIADYLKQLQVKFCLPIGGTIDIWAGNKRRAPRWLQKIGLEWLYRSYYDPRKAQVLFQYGVSFLGNLVRVRTRSNKSKGGARE